MRLVSTPFSINDIGGIIGENFIYKEADLLFDVSSPLFNSFEWM